MSKATSSPATTNGKSSSSSSAPRLCHVIKVEDFDGYGFNLHAEKGKPGQYIGKVDDGSPAERAGLRQGDRIIEVNAVNIGRETHKEVVQRIKAIANEVQLLVVDPSVPVTKDNRLVDPIPVNGSSTTKSNGNAQPADSTTTDPKPVAVLTTPDIVVQLPSTPSTPKDTSSHTSENLENGHDEPDRVVVATPNSPVATKDTANSDEIIAIKINNESVTHPVTVASSKTSTFSTSPKNHGQRFSNSSYVSTASFSTSEVTEIKEEVVSTVSKVIISSTSSTDEQMPELPKSLPPPLEAEPVTKILPSVTSSSASPPASPKPIVAPTVPIVSPTVPTVPTVPIVSPTITTTTSLTNGTSSSALSSPPAPSSNGIKPTTTTGSSGLNLNMTAAELRAKLAAKKKFDPKAGSVDLRKKFEIIEKL